MALVNPAIHLLSEAALNTGMHQKYPIMNFGHFANGTVRFNKCKQLCEYQHLLLLRDIWWLKLLTIFKCSFFQHQSYLNICGSLIQLFSCIGV